MADKCPKCGSLKTESVADHNMTFVVCRACGYDESMYDVTDVQRSTQREKGRYNPYKAGGSKRTR